MDNNKNKDSFLKGALILGAAGVVVKIMGAFFRIPLGNLIGSTGMGYYQAVYPVYTLFLTTSIVLYTVLRPISFAGGLTALGVSQLAFNLTSYKIFFIACVISLPY